MRATSPNLQASPFHLGEDDIAWVLRIKQRLAGPQRLAQLFNVMLDTAADASLATLRRLQPGAITQFTLGGLMPAVAAAQGVLAAADVPVLVSGDVEGGSICLDGTTPMPNQLGMAALADPQLYRQALQVMVDEARAIGIDWTFSPVTDVNAAFRSSIVGTRSFGAEPQRVGDLTALHIGVVQAAGLAATAKHWPGEGFDDRDQHLVTTLNPLSLAQWHEVFGTLYRRAIGQGVKTIMAGHIAWPAYARAMGAEGVEAYRPASISTLLNTQLLRGELGFNGLLVSDATPMGGLTSWSPREAHLPEVIESGCDMILFSQDLEADIAILQRALADGRLSEQRVDEALTRVLALKASLGLHRRPRPATPTEAELRAQLRTEAHMRVARRAASASVTLVKDTQHTLPLNPQRHRRITVVTATADPALTPFAPPQVLIPDLLRARGFEVRDYDPADPPTPDNTDLMLYVMAHESLMTAGAIQFDWRRLHGPIWHAMRRNWHEVPNVLVSLGHPYYLNDAPRMPCVVNAYTCVATVQQAVVAKLLGEEPFVGGHPVDASCGRADALY
ncbi:glycoside hydrolase family 3 protein [Aquabacterium sp. OR-4]|uniref:glycoside hydrolase family 3 protein n=1 Tax=Aquabacterium sp. OR-4 TaxID=2978127 RepID=UPI0028C5FF3B|nr:glycoside hydrolase family 3 N-terminal domain-containing protein [Aquabacterium sp. OR-4]MDT7838575.1 glycoside hydrolase family 3 N-terminal domain-containing protein [Aquabacterium sp. OR-4]